MHPKIRSLWLTTALALLTLAGTSIQTLTAVERAVAFGQTARTASRKIQADSIVTVDGQQVSQNSTGDPQQSAADAVFKEGMKLYQQGTAESLRAAIAKFEEAARLYSMAGNRGGEAITINNVGMIYSNLGEQKKALGYFKQALSLMRSANNYDGEATVLSNIGKAYNDLGEKQTALRYFNQALSLSKSTGAFRREAIILNYIGLIFSTLGEQKKALNFYKDALLIVKTVDDDIGEATTLNNIAMVYETLGERQKALRYLNQALSLRETLGDSAETATTLNNIGLVYFELGERQKALIYYNQALTIYKTIGDQRGEVNTFNNISKFYNTLGEKREALVYLNQALLLTRTVGDRHGEANTLNNIGMIYNDLGEQQKALDYLNLALPLRRAVGDRRGEAKTTNDIGVVHDNLGRKHNSLVLYSQALLLWKDVGDRAGEATALNNIGGIYDSLGNRQKALNYFDQALLLQKAVGNLQGEADALNNIRGIYIRLGERQRALAHFNKLLLIYKALGDRHGEANTFHHIGIIYATLSEEQQALKYLNQALMLRQTVGDSAGEAITLSSIGSVYWVLGENQIALTYYNQALPLSKAVGDRSGEATTLSNIAYLLARQKQPALAIFFYKQSVNITESLRNDIRGLPKDIQQTYTQTVASSYRTLADLLLQQNRILEAQQVLDLLKVQELEDYLKTVRGNAQTAKGVDYLQPEQQILTQFNEPLKTAIQLGEELSQLRNIPESNRTPAQQQRITQLVNLEAQLNQQFNDFTNSPAVQTALAQLNPSTLRQTVDLADLDALRDNLRQLNAVLLYPLILPNRLELIITTPNSAPLQRTVNLSSTELNKTILEFRQQMEACQTSPCTTADTEKVKATSQKLYTWLIKPLEADLKQTNAQSILYAPDGQLRYIPLAALHDGHQWLTQRLRINNITAKSLSNLAPQSNTPPLKVLAGAFTQGSYQFNVGTQQFSFDGLPFAKKEISQLVAAVPGTTQFLDQSFSLAAVTPRMNEYSVLHLATHAAFLPGQPEDSFILFGNGDRATLRDIGQWTLNNIDMVILSACETGLGLKLGNGVEILGLGYQFQTRGVKATIASLWQVNDESTQLLMNTLYAQLKKGNTSKAEALRQAQLTLMQSKGGSSGQTKGSISVQSKEGTSASSQTIDYNHPYYWAPFILIGNGL
jgi:CHAT domain-containing protein/Flp pilus assembly protein TadD